MAECNPRSSGIGVYGMAPTSPSKDHHFTLAFLLMKRLAMTFLARDRWISGHGISGHGDIKLAIS